MSKYLNFFSNCFFTLGVNRATILDSQKKKLYIIPIALVEFVNKASQNPINLVKGSYGESDQVVINEYEEFLLNNDLAFYCDSKEESDRFPPLCLDWDYPAHFTNAIIEVDGLVDIDRFLIFKKSFFIPYVQLIVYAKITKSIDLLPYIERINDGYTKGVELLFDNSCGLSESELVDICNSQGILEMIIGFNSNDEATVSSISAQIVLTRQKEFSHKYCGVVGDKYFSYQLNHYTESLRYNTCLNRKISINVNGEIKNCPSMVKSYGNVTESSIEEILSNNEFKKLWTIDKSKITVCKDCEFRNVCTDCRAYLEKPEDLYSKPLKCGYDPYKLQWADWRNIPIKEEAILYYAMTDVT